MFPSSCCVGARTHTPPRVHPHPIAHYVRLNYITRHFIRQTPKVEQKISDVPFLLHIVDIQKNPLEKIQLSWCEIEILQKWSKSLPWTAEGSCQVTITVFSVSQRFLWVNVRLRYLNQDKSKHNSSYLTGLMPYQATVLCVREVHLDGMILLHIRLLWNGWNDEAETGLQVCMLSQDQG